jgi:hypothetical protein
VSTEPNRERWLNGWERQPGAAEVYVAGTFRCVGCGRIRGVPSIVVEAGHVESRPEPDWPFEVEGCPAHTIPSTAAERVEHRGPLP